MPRGWPVSRPPGLVKILADQHISPRTVEFLQSLGHDAIRVSDRLPVNASDRAILALARQERRVVLTQDLDFSVLITLAGETQPSIITLRLESPRVERVNEVLRSVLPRLADAVEKGAIVTVEDARFRVRRLPIE
jgi:predicted nuclease of predicted toxin-antitoxin system